MIFIVAVLAVIAPRVTLILLALFTSYFDGVFETILLPILGFIFLPLTTIAYAGVTNASGEIQGLGLVIVAASLLIDIGGFGWGLGRRRASSRAYV